MPGIYKHILSFAVSFSLSGLGHIPVQVNSTDYPVIVEEGVPRSHTGPTFTVDEGNLHRPVTVIAYGDIRFTDPNNETATNPTARRALVTQIALEKPDAILLSGDVPWHGGDQGDYSVYLTETNIWRINHLRIYPALGNHEFYGCEIQQCLENWWTAFPQLRDRRWYSVALGHQLYVISLDSTASLLPGSDQRRWLVGQVSSLSTSVRFVLIVMHHPPVADIQRVLYVDHNPRPNEIALASFLKNVAGTSRARYLVIAGHIHNYERFLQDDVEYLVSGGGGAQPYPVERTVSDLYQESSFPNFHYVELVLEDGNLKGTMYRLDPTAASPVWDAKDTFQLRAK
jgi:calcineurin-like phosphoesterase family protein